MGCRLAKFCLSNLRFALFDSEIPCLQICKHKLSQNIRVSPSKRTVTNGAYIHTLRPFVLPHTSSVACNKQSFKPVQMFSKSSASLLDSLACTFSTKRLYTLGSFRHHTFCLLTNSFLFFLIFAPRCATLTNNLCCGISDTTTDYERWIIL